MTEIEKAWLACAIDGEGNISLYKHKRYFKKQRPYARPYIWKASIKINNSYKLFCDRAKIITQTGNVCLNSKENPQKNKVAAWAWNCNPRGVTRILTEILPYLIIKKQQAMLVIESRRLIEEHVYTHHNDDKLERIKTELNRINKHGVA